MNSSTQFLAPSITAKVGEMPRVINMEFAAPKRSTIIHFLTLQANFVKELAPKAQLFAHPRIHPRGHPRMHPQPNSPLLSQSKQG